MNQDTVSALYDFPAREYGIQGRWPSPDPAGMSAVDPSDPQTWNRYAYVRNSPLAVVDPTGLFECPICLPQSGGGNGLGYDICFFAPGVCGGGGFIQSPPVQPPGQCFYILLDPCGGGNGGRNPGNKTTSNWFTLGIRAPGQTWSQCMATNANTYSIGGATELAVNVATGTSSNISQTTSIATGNGITGLIFEGPGAGDFFSVAGYGAGSPVTYGRRTSDIISLNLAGNGGLPQALGSTGAQDFFETAGKWLGLGLDESEKFSVDAGLAGAEAVNCTIPR